MLYHIYAFRDPRNGRFFYAGSSLYPHTRLGVQLALARRGDWTASENLELTFRILHLLFLGKEPELIILQDSLAEGEWQDAEQGWIVKLRKEGHPLLNKRPGGHGPTKKPYPWKQVALSLSLKQVDRLEQAAKEQGCSIRDCIREAIDAYWGKDDRRTGSTSAGISEHDSAGSR